MVNGPSSEITPNQPHTNEAANPSEYLNHDDRETIRVLAQSMLQALSIEETAKDELAKQLLSMKLLGRLEVMTQEMINEEKMLINMDLGKLRRAAQNTLDWLDEISSDDTTPAIELIDFTINHLIRQGQDEKHPEEATVQIINPSETDNDSQKIVGNLSRIRSILEPYKHIIRNTDDGTLSREELKARLAAIQREELSNMLRKRGINPDDFLK